MSNKKFFELLGFMKDENVMSIHLQSGEIVSLPTGDNRPKLPPNIKKVRCNYCGGGNQFDADLCQFCGGPIE